MAIERPEAERTAAPNQSVRGRRAPRKSSQSISKINQAIVSSLNSVSDSLNRMERGLSSLTRTFTQEMQGMHKEANKYQKDTSDHLKQNADDSKKAMQEVVRSNEQILSDFERSVRRIGNVMKTAMGFFIGTVIIKGVRKITSFLELNLFDFMTARIKQLNELLLSIVPGAEAALATLRTSQDTLARVQQQYGMSVSERENWLSWSREMATVFMRPEELIASVEAVYAAGIGGSRERRAEFARETAYTSQITGAALEDTAAMYRRLIDIQGLSHEEARRYMDTVHQYIATSREELNEAFGIQDYMNSFNSSFERFQDIDLFSPDNPASVWNFQKMLVATNQAAADANVSVEGLLDLVTQSVTGDPQMLSLIGMSPVESADLIAQGKVVEYYQNIGDAIHQVFDEVDSITAAEQINKALGTSYGVGELLRIADALDNISTESMPLLDQALADSSGSWESFESGLAGVTTEVERFQGQINSTMDDMDFGDMKMIEVFQWFDNLIPQVESLSGAFSGLGEVTDMLFGPFSFLVKPAMNMTGTLFMLGGMVEELSEMERMAASGTPLEGIFDLGSTVIDQFLPGAENILRNIGNIFDQIFTDMPGSDKSLFQSLIEKFVDWLNTDEVIGEHGMITKIIDGLTHLFETLTTQFDTLMTSEFGTKLTGFLVVLVGGIARVLGTMIRAMVPIVTIMLKTMGDVLSDSGVMVAVGEFVGTLFHSIGSAIKDNWDNIKAALMPLAMIIWEVLKIGFFGLMTLIAPVIDYITSKIPIPGFQTNLADQYRIENIEDFMNQTGVFASQTVTIDGVEIDTSGTNIWENLGTMASDPIGAITGGFNTTVGAVAGVGTAPANQALQGAGTAGDWTIPGTYIAPIDRVYEDVTQGGRPVSEGLNVYNEYRQTFDRMPDFMSRGITGYMNTRQEDLTGGAALPWDATKFASGGPGVSSPYGWRMVDGQKDFHEGIDYLMGVGSEVRAIQGGVVDYVGSSGAGAFIRILTDAGRYWEYHHLAHSSVEDFTPGERIIAGQMIGAVGDIGRNHLDVRTFISPEVEAAGVGSEISASDRENLPWDNPERIMQQLGLDFAYEVGSQERTWSNIEGYPTRIRGDTLQTTSSDSLGNVPGTNDAARAFAETLSKDIKRTADAVEKIVSDAQITKMEKELDRAMGRK
jgi:ElaB/YqjD/DUF883 family membrane-anchored ribosome-binding protein